jgi:hypothetical protein
MLEEEPINVEKHVTNETRNEILRHMTPPRRKGSAKKEKKEGKSVSSIFQRKNVENRITHNS